MTDPFKALFDDCCRYEGDDFERVLTWISERGNQDDKLVAVTLAYRLVRETKQPDEGLAKLRDRVKTAPVLAEHLEGMISWKPSRRQQAMDERLERLDANVRERTRWRKRGVAGGSRI